MGCVPSGTRKICLFMTVLGLHCFPGLSLIAVSECPSLVVVNGLLTVVTSLGAQQRLCSARAPAAAAAGSVVVAHGLGCSVARGIVLDRNLHTRPRGHRHLFCSSGSWRGAGFLELKNPSNLSFFFYLGENEFAPPPPFGSVEGRGHHPLPKGT